MYFILNKAFYNLLSLAVEEIIYIVYIKELLPPKAQSKNMNMFRRLGTGFTEGCGLT